MQWQTANIQLRKYGARGSGYSNVTYRIFHWLVKFSTNGIFTIPRNTTFLGIYHNLKMYK